MRTKSISLNFNKQNYPSKPIVTSHFSVITNNNGEITREEATTTTEHPNENFFTQFFNSMNMFGASQKPVQSETQPISGKVLIFII